MKTTIIIIISIIVIAIIFFSSISKGSVTPTNRGSAPQRSLPLRRPRPNPSTSRLQKALNQICRFTWFGLHKNKTEEFGSFVLTEQEVIHASRGHFGSSRIRIFFLRGCVSPLSCISSKCGGVEAHVEVEAHRPKLKSSKTQTTPARHRRMNPPLRRRYLYMLKWTSS